MIKESINQNILQNMQKIVRSQVVQSPPSKNTPTLYIPSSIRNMLASGTYNTNVSRELDLNKHRHIS